jgi:hypothetical protein
MRRQNRLTLETKPNQIPLTPSIVISSTVSSPSNIWSSSPKQSPLSNQLRNFRSGSRAKDVDEYAQIA